jgi:hypothetical protein
LVEELLREFRFRRDGVNMIAQPFQQLGGLGILSRSVIVLGVT